MAGGLASADQHSLCPGTLGLRCVWAGAKQPDLGSYFIPMPLIHLSNGNILRSVVEVLQDLLFCLVMLGVESWTYCMLNMHPTTELVTPPA